MIKEKVTFCSHGQSNIESCFACRTAKEEKWRSISKCWQNNGYHALGAGPCFDTLEQAIRYRDYVEEHGYELARLRYG